MSDDLSNAQIALLCEIGEDVLATPDGNRNGDVEQLVDAGYVAPMKDHRGTGFKLTAKGVALLGKRGAGLNEA
jgi:hypothetical protein